MYRLATKIFVFWVLLNVHCTEKCKCLGKLITYLFFFILEIDDVEDLEIISLILEPSPPEGYHVVNTQSLPGLCDLEIARNLQMFTQVWRAKLPTSQKVGSFPKHFLRLLQTIYFKLRSMVPVAICDLKFRLDLPEGDEFQILVNGKMKNSIKCEIVMCSIRCYHV